MFKVDGIDLIGKTGTAQIYDASRGGYNIETNENHYIFSFAGMFPKEDPEYIIYTVIKTPLWGKNAGVVESTKSVIESIVKYENLDNKDDDNKLTTYEISSYINKNAMDIKNELESNNLDVILIGNGEKIIKQSSESGTTLLQGDKIILLTGNSYEMPNIIGWSRNDAITLFKMLGIKYEASGYGYVTSQSIAAGTTITNDMNIVVTLEKKYNNNSE